MFQRKWEKKGAKAIRQKNGSSSPMGRAIQPAIFLAMMLVKCRIRFPRLPFRAMLAGNSQPSRAEKRQIVSAKIEKTAQAGKY